MSPLLEAALRRVAALPREEQDAIASQIIDTLQDEAAWKQRFAHTRKALDRLAEDARQEHERRETRPLDDLL